MSASSRTLNDLFEQLGLPSDHRSIEAFVRQHSPLADAKKLAEAPFWTSSQASFLREQVLQDADWALAVDALNLQLRGS